MNLSTDDVSLVQQFTEGWHNSLSDDFVVVDVVVQFVVHVLLSEGVGVEDVVVVPSGDEWVDDVPSGDEGSLQISDNFLSSDLSDVFLNFVKRESLEDFISLTGDDIRPKELLQKGFLDQIVFSENSLGLESVPWEVKSSEDVLLRSLGEIRSFDDFLFSQNVVSDVLLNHLDGEGLEDFVSLTGDHVLQKVFLQEGLFD